LTEDMVKEIKLVVREKIGAIAVPHVIQEASGLPKTRSGKVTRRILRKIADGDRNVGDTSTLIDENVINEIWKTRSNIKF